MARRNVIQCRATGLLAPALILIIVSALLLYNSSKIIKDKPKPSIFTHINVQEKGQNDNNKNMSKLHQKSLIVILLQQSPVQPVDQIKRLNNIDNTWAHWTMLPPITHSTRLVSAVLNTMELMIRIGEPESSLQPQSSYFERIDSIPMYPDSKTNIFDKSVTYDSYTPSNYHNMLRSFNAIFTSKSPLYQNIKWLVFANDHTFILPTNLDKFLVTLDASDLVYTGNHLALQITKDNTLSFISGGAGAVLSHATVKLILLVWYSVGVEDKLVDALRDHVPDIRIRKQDKQQGQRGIALCEPVALTGKDNTVFYDARRNSDKFLCVLDSVKTWLMKTQDNSGSRTGDSHENEVIQVQLSDKVTTTLQKGTATTTISNHTREGNRPLTRQEVIKRLTVTLTVSNSTVVTATGEKLLKYCTVKDKWSHQNPGIILANCLQNVFHVSVTPSTSGSVYEQPLAQTDETAQAVVSSELRGRFGIEGERFNCYDPLRLLTSEVDDWYTKGKTLALDKIQNYKNEIPGSDNSVHKNDNGGDMALLVASGVAGKLSKMPTLALDVISYHYVDIVEAQLLFDVLEKKRLSDTAVDITAKLIRSSWPKTQAEAGVYSRHLKKDSKEAELLSHYLSNGVLL